LAPTLPHGLFERITPQTADEKENTMTIVELAMLINALSGLIGGLAQILTVHTRR
jgi:hypothetical protein